jgi:putative FmdB family regulatory protein
MPLFEYECRGCGKRFEHLTRSDRPPVCPGCDGKDLAKQFSVFAAQSSTQSKSTVTMPSGACGSCGHPDGPGSCSVH